MPGNGMRGQVVLGLFVSDREIRRIASDNVIEGARRLHAFHIPLAKSQPVRQIIELARALGHIH